MEVIVQIRNFEYIIYCSNTEQSIKWLCKSALCRFENEMNFISNSLIILDSVLFPSRMQLFPDTPIKMLFEPIKRLNKLTKIRRKSNIYFNETKNIKDIKLINHNHNKSNPELPTLFIPKIKIYIADTLLDRHSNNCKFKALFSIKCSPSYIFQKIINYQVLYVINNQLNQQKDQKDYV